MTAVYDGLEFDTKLKARWAAFFDLAGWEWAVNPVSIENWKPDFRVRFSCSHSECHDFHTLLISVLPISSIDSFKFHPCLEFSYGVPSPFDSEGQSLADGGAAFGNDPSVTQWEIVHGAGGGIEDLYGRVPDADQLWSQTTKLVRELR